LVKKGKTDKLDTCKIGDKKECPDHDFVAERINKNEVKITPLKNMKITKVQR